MYGAEGSQYHCSSARLQTDFGDSADRIGPSPEDADPGMLVGFIFSKVPLLRPRKLFAPG